MINLLAIPGSLRENSSSNLVLREVIKMAPPQVSIEIFGKLADLPHFDDASEAPKPVQEFRKQVKNADAILICTPEYAFGIPGSLKNALDWTVGSGEFNGKPVGLITASSNGEKGHAALLLVLQAINAEVISDATLLIQFVRAKLNSDGTIKDEKVAEELKKVLNALVQVKKEFK